MEEASRFANYYDNVTTLHPLGVAILVVAVILTFTLPRRYVFLPIILVGVLVPAAQRIVIAGFDFHFLRLLTAVAWIRALSRGEASTGMARFRWTQLDKVIIGWTCARMVVVVLRRASFGAVVNQLGQGFDTLGIYFLARLLIRSWKDFDRIVICFVIAAIPIAGFFIYEVQTETNPFHIFGGFVEEAKIRDGRVRARGAFSHQILAGCFFVGVLPLIASRFWRRDASVLFTVFSIAVFMVPIIACASSTPLLGVGIALIAAAAFPLRYRMSRVRRGIVAALVVMQMAMAKPIWHLIHRVGSLGLGSSTSYHRYLLIDAFVRKFPSWAVLGVNSTKKWGPRLDDVTNHFVAQGAKGGLATFALFIAFWVAAFRQLGWLVHGTRGNRARQICAWSLGVSVFSHMAMMNATSYFGQILLEWNLIFATIATLSQVHMPGRARAQPRVRARAQRTSGVGPPVPGRA